VTNFLLANSQALAIVKPWRESVRLRNRRCINDLGRRGRRYIFSAHRAVGAQLFAAAGPLAPERHSNITLRSAERESTRKVAVVTITSKSAAKTIAAAASLSSFTPAFSAQRLPQPHSHAMTNPALILNGAPNCRKTAAASREKPACPTRNASCLDAMLNCLIRRDYPDKQFPR
jgi:hypothetical protein